MVWQGGRLYEQREVERKTAVVIVGTFIFLIILILRLFYLQVVQGKYYTAISESNRTEIFFQRASRGVIYDANQEVLVDHRPTFVVLFSPLKVSPEVFSNVLKTLEKILSLPVHAIEKMVGGENKRSVVLRIADEISRSALFRILEARPNLPGVTITIEPTRRYPYKDWASHLIGYLGEINPAELAERLNDGYKQGNIVGKNGIEKVYDYYLRGKSGGMQLEVDATGRSQRILYNIPSIPGNDLYINIDLHVQQAAENMFKKQGFSGAAVAVDPGSGKVLALVSSPNFDPNIFLKPLDSDTREYLFLSETKPLFNRALQGQYALGSVFKIITMAAALESGSELTHQTLLCKGMFKLGRREFGCWEKKGHGKVDLLKAITHSCDVYFYQLGLSAGLERIVETSRQFGLGSLSGIDLPEEKQGLLPDANWKKKFRREIWYDGDTVNLSIGQGFLLVTPLQVACFMGAVASRGKLFRPYIFDRIVDPQGSVILSNTPHLIRQIHLKPETWDTLHQGLINVIENGTGRACRIRGLEVAGKTGTAENPHGEDHAWFAAYAALPGEKSRIAVVVLVEHGEHGASAAAPIAREMIKAAFPELDNAG
ncbi:MAG: penicillin-binding protein 2 [bacterium]